MGHPAKTSRADGSIVTVCSVGSSKRSGGLNMEASNLINILWYYAYYLDLRPNILVAGDLCSTGNCKIRTLRSHTHTTHLSMTTYLVELVDGFRGLRIRMEERGRNPPKVVENYLERSLAERGVPDISLKISRGAVDATLGHLRNAWRAIIHEIARMNGYEKGRMRDFRVDPYITGFLSVARRCRDKRGGERTRSWCELLQKLSELHQLALYSIFLRRHRTLLLDIETMTLEDMVVNVASSFRNALHNAERTMDEETLESLQWFGLAYCCYSGIGMSPVLVWFSTTFGTEMPPLTASAYTPRSTSRAHTDAGLMVEVPPTLEDYGYHSPGTMSRYTRMHTLDALIMSNSIDMTALHFIGDPWHRSAVYGSFYRTLALSGVEPVASIWKEDREYLMTVPVINRIGRTGVRTPMVVTPQEERIDIGDEARETARDFLRMIIYSGTRADKREAGKAVLHILEDEVRKWEDDYAKRLRRIYADYRGRNRITADCVKGIIVEAYHPFAFLFLFREVAERDVAFLPGPQESWNIIYTLMNRLMDADYVRIRFYYMLNAKQLIESYNTFRSLANDNYRRLHPPHLLRLSVHTVYNTVPEDNGDYAIFTVESYGIERIMQALLYYEYLRNKDRIKRIIPCFEELIQVTKNVIEPVRG